jgi:hypothetical protein
MPAAWRRSFNANQLANNDTHAKCPQYDNAVLTQIMLQQQRHSHHVPAVRRRSFNSNQAATPTALTPRTRSTTTQFQLKSGCNNSNNNNDTHTKCPQYDDAASTPTSGRPPTISDSGADLNTDIMTDTPTPTQILAPAVNADSKQGIRRPGWANIGPTVRCSGFLVDVVYGSWLTFIVVTISFSCFFICFQHILSQPKCRWGH